MPDQKKHDFGARLKKVDTGFLFLFFGFLASQASAALRFFQNRSILYQKPANKKFQVENHTFFLADLWGTLNLIFGAFPDFLRAESEKSAFFNTFFNEISVFLRKKFRPQTKQRNFLQKSAPPWGRKKSCQNFIKFIRQGATKKFLISHCPAEFFDYFLMKTL